MPTAPCARSALRLFLQNTLNVAYKLFPLQDGLQELRAPMADAQETWPGPPPTWGTPGTMPRGSSRTWTPHGKNQTSQRTFPTATVEPDYPQGPCMPQ